MSDEEDDIEDVRGEARAFLSPRPSSSWPSRPLCRPLTARAAYPPPSRLSSSPRSSLRSFSSSPVSASSVSGASVPSSCSLSGWGRPDVQVRKPAGESLSPASMATSPSPVDSSPGVSCCSSAASLPSSLPSSLSSSSAHPTDEGREGTFAREGEFLEKSEKERRLHAPGLSEGDEGHQTESTAQSLGGLSSLPLLPFSTDADSQVYPKNSPKEDPPSSEKDQALATAGAHAVEELLAACNGLLSQVIGSQEERGGGPGYLSASLAFPHNHHQSLVNAMNAVFDFWPLTGQAQPECLTEFCSLISRSQDLWTSKKAVAPQTHAPPKPDSRDDRSQSCASLPPSRSLILEPSNDEMEDLFAVLTSPNRSLERKKASGRNAETRGQATASAANGSSRRDALNSACMDVESGGASSLLSSLADAPPVSLGLPGTVTVSSGDEAINEVIPDTAELDDDLDCSLVPPPAFWSEKHETCQEAVPLFSQEDLPLSRRQPNGSKSKGPTPRSSKKPPLRRSRDDESQALLSEVDVDEDESIASWATARRRKAPSASPTPASPRAETGGGGEGEADPFHVAFQRMQKIFGRGAAREEQQGRDLEDRRRTTLVCGASAEELVRDLPAHLRRWFAKDFPFSARVDRINKEVFGYTDFRGLQLGAINAVMSGRDCFLVMPTGGGKSLCYQLPAYALGGLTLVISPLLALMGDQLRSLKNLGVEAAKIDGEISKSDLLALYDELSQPSFSLRVLMATPEFLARSEALTTVLRSVHARGLLSLLVVDEAHCVCQWGEDFRADYLSLGRLKKTFPDVPLLALTASASPDVFSEVKRILRIPKSVDFRMSINRPNLFLEVREKSRQTIYDIHRLLSSPALRNEAGIIYCLSIKDCEVVASHLISLDIRAAPYHAKMASRRRQETQAAWMAGDIAVIVSTVAFGLGVDRPDVRFVFHHSMPPSLERYYQEIGRAGRDGYASRCILFYSPGDVQRVSKLLVRPKRGSGGERGEKGRLGRLEKMVHFCEASVECRRQLLLHAFDEELCETAPTGCGGEQSGSGPGDRSGAGEDDEEADGLQTRAKAENSWMRKGKICARSCDNCWKKTHLTVQYHDVTVYAQKLVLLLLAQERTCGTGYGSGLTRKQLCDAARGAVRQQPLQDKMRHNEHLGCMKGIATGDIETLIRHMVKDRWLVETVVSKKGRFASYVVLRPGEAAHTPLRGPKPLIVPNFLRPSSAPRQQSPKISSLNVSLSRSPDEETSVKNSEELDSSLSCLCTGSSEGVGPHLSGASKYRREPSLPLRKKQRFVVVPEVSEKDSTNIGAGHAPSDAHSAASRGEDPDLGGDLDNLLGLPLDSSERSPSSLATGECGRFEEMGNALRSGSASAKRPVSLQQLLREGRRADGAGGDQEGKGDSQRENEGNHINSTSSSLHSSSPSCRPPSTAAMIWKALSADAPLTEADTSEQDEAVEVEGSFSRNAPPVASFGSLDLEKGGKVIPDEWPGFESKPGSPPSPSCKSPPLSGPGGQNGAFGLQLHQKKRRQTTLSSFVRPKKLAVGSEEATHVQEHARPEGDEDRERIGVGEERIVLSPLAEQPGAVWTHRAKEKEPEDSKAEVAEAIRQAQIDAMKRNGVTRKLPTSWLRRA
ncbi:ATP-dependent DNA helicase, RecQ family protein [Toxoplasma gondii TgCatPRC2]|uniref:DNA 3'-5' helicase n=3 Tax=Toxoplasma gondii TaxID=5811 RepID=A0A151H5K8_TOXGO|nr:ATP-dependent DNA helicase, RecQ family protein [Toxoplasma gondii ARI]KYK64645.1 ATP-dependent DNA helicase, RecQ family protein [Toxoplasma gondii TgCatPRC2]PIL97119.1 ATP-dependent DNA helicase, RecQ family protein [Toxoplasma gondii COUG]